MTEFTQQRAAAHVVVTMDTPAIISGLPVIPANWTTWSSSSHGIQGKKHIHQIPFVAKVVKDYEAPPLHTGGPPWKSRWSVDSLPDPAAYGGYYWLGDATSQDGTASIQSGARQWAPDSKSTANTPAWRSRFPFKPSVTSVDHYLQGGGIVHHPKGVNFNSHYIEHMWASFADRVPQPFTWVIAGMIASWPSENYTQSMLDGGVDPAKEGIYYSADDCYTPRRMKDDLTARTSLSVTQDQLLLTAHPGGKMIRERIATRTTPCMYAAVFNGDDSYVGVYRPGHARLRRGKLEGDSCHSVVLGRHRGWLSQDRASHMLLFDIRFWDHALDQDDLKAQYDQLASANQFDRYREQ